MPWSRGIPTEGCNNINPVFPCGFIPSYDTSFQGPIWYALQMQIPLSVNPKLLSLLILLILFVPPVSLAKLVAATTTLLPLTPPRDSRASFIFAAVATSCFLFTYHLCAFIGAIFLSHMSFPACCSEKLYLLICLPVLEPMAARASNKAAL